MVEKLIADVSLLLDRILFGSALAFMGLNHFLVPRFIANWGFASRSTNPNSIASVNLRFTGSLICN